MRLYFIGNNAFELEYHQADIIEELEVVCSRSADVARGSLLIPSGKRGWKIIKPKDIGHIHLPDEVAENQSIGFEAKGC